MRISLLVFMLTACNGGGADCTTLVDGDWSLDGSALGMTMGATVTMDVATCAFTLADWSMAMDPLPNGGTIAGDQLTLSGADAMWAGCTGTVNADGTSAAGACEDGSAFSMDAGALDTMGM